MRRNKSGLPKHCSWNTDRHGKRRVRFRRGGFSTYLTGEPWSTGFMEQYAVALDGTKAQTANIGMERTKPGTINALVVSYYTLVFPTLEPSTQKMRRSILERLRRSHGDKPVARLETAHIAAIVAAMKQTPTAANNFRKVLHSLLEHAMGLGWVRSNPAKLVRRFKIKGDGFHVWSESEVSRYIERHPAGSKAYLALMLMLCTGQRRSDIIRLGFQHLRDGKIAVRQKKTDTPLLLPVAPELAQVLKDVPRKNLTFLLTAFGAPFSFNGFGNWFRDRCNEAGLRQCSAHGLRKLAATRMANAGEGAMYCPRYIVALAAFIAGVATLTCAQAATVRAGSTVTVVRDVSGSVSGTSWEKKIEGDDVYESEFVRTAARSSAVLSLLDQTKISRGKRRPSGDDENRSCRHET